MKALLAVSAATVAMLGSLSETASASADPGSGAPNPAYAPPFIDHTLLKPEATTADVVALVTEAAKLVTTTV